jgi:hypothetical protein
MILNGVVITTYFHCDFIGIFVCHSIYTSFWTVRNHVSFVNKVHILETSVHEDNCHFFHSEDEIVFYLSWTLKRKHGFYLTSWSSIWTCDLCFEIFVPTVVIWCTVKYYDGYWIFKCNASFKSSTYGVQCFVEWNATSSCNV